jgi:bifunctional enzyme Fae/Hps
MLDKKQRYLQIALNSDLDEAKNIINQISLDKRILIEAGTPLIKAYGSFGIRQIRNYWMQKVFGNISDVSKVHPLITLMMEYSAKKRKDRLEQDITFTPYIVADMKCMDRGVREVEIAKEGGANAVTALGHAPIETLDAFIENCEKSNLDSMIDMMNVDYPSEILGKLKKQPQVVILHRGVDEETFNQEKEIPYHEIQRIKGSYDIMVAIAGGDTFHDAQTAIFNDADIVVVWKSFYASSKETAKLAEDFLREIR